MFLFKTRYFKRKNYCILWTEIVASCQKVQKSDFKSISYVKNEVNFSKKKFHLRTSFHDHIFCYWHFLKTYIFKTLHFLKWCPIFDNSPTAHQFPKYNTFLLEHLFLAKKLSNFVSLSWKLDNPYYHITESRKENLGYLRNRALWKKTT